MINLVVKPDAIKLPAGAVVRVPGTWQDYQALLEHLGDRACPRVKYRNGELLLMVPLPEHGKQIDIVADMVKVLLRHQGLKFDSYPETTMALPEHSGIMSTIETQVIIVGAGVAGGTLACALAHRGIHSIVFERRQSSGDRNRGDGMQPRSLEIMETWGFLGLAPQPAGGVPTQTRTLPSDLGTGKSYAPISFVSAESEGC